MKFSIHCSYCNHKYVDFAYSNTETKLFKCSRCESGRSALDVKLEEQDVHLCRDCGNEVVEGNSARCKECWNDRMGY